MDGWRLIYDAFDPQQESLREALCTLGNGYFATRGAAAEACADEVHYPGTYVAGLYNRLQTEIAGRMVENEDLVNVPNWLPLTLRLEDGDWFSLSEVDILEYRQVLDLQQGLLLRHVRFRDAHNRETSVTHRRIVHMRTPHLAALETTLCAENWSGMVELCSALDGRVRNGGVARYRDLSSHHLEAVDAAQLDAETMFLQMRTNQSGVDVALAARTRVRCNGAALDVERRTVTEPTHVAQHAMFEMKRGEACSVEKVATLYTCRDRAVTESGHEARAAVACAGDFEELFASHTLAWADLWRRFDIRIEANHANGDYAPLLVLRLHLFHLIQTTSPHSRDLDVGVPARGWHGEAYRGHIFWDELFIFPVLNLRMPEITRALLRYRVRRLDAARRAASEEGLAGALYPWQSGSNGREETQQLHLNPRSGRWNRDNTHLQRHVNAAIAYNIWQYYQVTGDLEFMSFYGAEMLLEIARFWASIATYNEARDRYEILKVMGPDEYHDAYPGAAEPGLDNNAYTNFMAAWVLHRALDTLELLPEDTRVGLCERLVISEDEVFRWQEIIRKICIVYQDGGIISQFEGYEQLEPFDWDAYRERYGDIQRLDRILEAEDQSPNDFQVSKQADLLMLFYLFSAEELQQVLQHAGYSFDPDMIPRNVEYYLQRTSHGSTLSRVVHAWVLARADRDASWEQFLAALQSDVADIQGGTTSEGIHLGAMAGTVDLVQRCYTGVEARQGVLWFNPALPKDLYCLRMPLHYRGQSLQLTLTQERLTIEARRCAAPPIKVGFGTEVRELGACDTIEFELQ